MSSRVKKDRRLSGVPFSKTPKIPTPLERRREFSTTVRQPIGLRNAGQIVARSEKQLANARKAWRLDRTEGGDAK